VQRRDARLELIEFLLRINANAEAQSELIALAENLGEDSTQQAQVGDLFVRAQNYEHALAAYRVSLKNNRHNADALAGAGLAAFELGRYEVAQPYLQAAVDANSGDIQNADRLKTVELVLRMDPFREGISAAQRDHAVIEDFAAAGERMKSCGAGSGSLADLSDSWTRLKPQLTAARLRRDPDSVNKAMALVFSIERQTSADCGTPAGADLALLLIAKLHEGQ
jgi:tetratricopeptide (TPR) repeat protein